MLERMSIAALAPAAALLATISAAPAVDMDLGSSLRKQGPIPLRTIDGPWRMGPRFRGDDP